MIFLRERIGKLLRDLEGLIYTDETPVSGFRYVQSTEKFPDVSKVNTDDWAYCDRYPMSWGGHRAYYWFETFVTIPEEKDGQCIVYEQMTGKEDGWDATNPQFTIYVNDVLKQGLDINHREVLLTEHAKAGERYRIMLSAFTGDHNMNLVLDARIKVLHRETEKYYYDLKMPYDTACLLRESDTEYRDIILNLNESLNLLDLRKPYSDAYEKSLKAAQDYLDQEFYERYAGVARQKVYCVGHTHIDVAWKWTLAVTEDKAVRSFSTVLELMRRYPEYKFMSSQPQLYKYVKKNAPQVYEEIKERVKEGRWETEGGMFLEADCNLTSGESLVRQFLYGKRFFREEFGTDNEILWLPDVFGYSAALPQIMKKCGIRYFMTTKISWNEFNKMPYDTFEWEGIDGTRILTHFSPSRDYQAPAEQGSEHTAHFTTYNAFINPSQVKGAWHRYSQKYLNDEVLMSYGFGDGGGGPTKEMLENQRRLAKGIPGCPQTVQSTAADFFHELEDQVRGRKYLPVWVGELYLEYHRGTYTSMARNKNYNRRSEFLLENIECFSTLAHRLTGLSYPKQELDALWEIALRNQFHDILPGSSIYEVYEDSKTEYEKLLTEGHALLSNALHAIAEHTRQGAAALTVFNPNGWAQTGLVPFEWEDAHVDPVVSDGGNLYSVQKTADGAWLFRANAVPAKGWQQYAVLPRTDVKTKELVYRESGTLAASLHHLENDYLKVTLDPNGQFSSIYDKKARRELLKAGKNGNVLMTYEDRPHNYDAWDVNNYYVEKSWEITDVQHLSLIEDGPLRATIQVVRRYLDSEITQYISLEADSPELKIRNEIDWREQKIFLKTLFPVDIHTDEATYEIQYGNVTRKTHYNTSWDFARFEVCHHKWLDVAENGYGVSVLNDCKYGVSVHDGVIGLSMLKSATDPNPAADKEHHSFTYVIYPHSGDFREAGTINRAYALNNPLLAIQAKAAADSMLAGTEECQTRTADQLTAHASFVHTDAENVFIEVVKQAEDGDGVIIRLYEAFNRRADVTVSVDEFLADSGFALTEACDCNMLEEQETPLPVEGNEIRLTIRPFEIRTLRLRFN